MADLVKVGTFQYSRDAEQAKNLLAEKGISAMVSSDDVGGFRPDLSFTQGVQLLVEKVDLEKAQQILEVLQIPENAKEDEEFKALKLKMKFKYMDLLIPYAIILLLAGLAGFLIGYFYCPFEIRIALILISSMCVLMAIGAWNYWKGLVKEKKNLAEQKKS